MLILLAVVTSFSSIGCAQKTEKVQVVNTETFKEMLASGDKLLIDVRTPKEYEEGHVEGAINIDFFDQENFLEAYADFDRSQPVYLYCKSGNRSAKTAAKLVEMGFENIIDLDGGYTQWVIDQN